MCPPKPPKVENPAAAPAPAAQGADSLKLGGSDDTSLDQLARQGIIGRSLLRVGRGAKGTAATASSGALASGVATTAPASSGPGLAAGPSSTGGFSSGSSSGGSSSSASLSLGRGLSTRSAIE